MRLITLSFTLFAAVLNATVSAGVASIMPSYNAWSRNASYGKKIFIMPPSEIVVM